MKKLKEIFLLSILTVVGTALHAQWTPCKPCNPDPCLYGNLTNSTNCEIIFEVLFPGNPQCTPNLLLVIPANTTTSIPYAITCHKCIDGPCSCPIGLKLLDPVDQSTSLGTINFSNYSPPATVTNNYSTMAPCSQTLNVIYTLKSGSEVDIQITP
jgi:hypothetical protein